MSNIPCTRVRPTRTLLLKRMSSWVTRFSNSVFGSIRSIVTVPRAPDDRLRPPGSDGAISALLATYVAVIGIPGRFWYVKLVRRSQGRAYVPENFTCVCHGVATSQKADVRGAVMLLELLNVICGRPITTSQLFVAVRPVFVPPESCSPP